MTPLLTQQEKVRRDKKETLENLGIDPYPAIHFPINVKAQEILVNYDPVHNPFADVCIAGRLMARRVMGPILFGVLQDETARIQLYFKRDILCPGNDKTAYNQVVKKLVDIGDLIGVKGKVFRTKSDEITIEVQEFVLLAKAIRPLPVVKENEQGQYNAFTDPEQRYRQRYVDLVVNPSVRKVFQQRATLIATMRDYFNALNCLEVETPILQPIHGGAAARPFKTHHNALDIPLYLRIANELYLKRLIVGGFPGVYEFAKNFRNEGMSRFHNPEFTMVEVYVAYKDYYWMMDRTEELIEKVALRLHGRPQVTVGQHTINFQRPWKRMTLFDAIEHFTGENLRGLDEKALRKVAKRLAVDITPTDGKAKIIDAIFGDHCEPKLIQPTFITDYPIEMSPLARQHRDDPTLTERFEVICNGKELCNAYTELNDPMEQRKRFEAQLKLAQRGDDEAMALDEDFLRALAYGMPPTAGLGIGIDRLTMLMTNTASIRDVILFPQMRPESYHGTC